MGKFAETANANYRLAFVDQGKQTSVFRFHLQQTNGSCRFCFPYIYIYIYIETTNESYYLLVCKRTKRTCPSMLYYALEISMVLFFPFPRSVNILG
jgi:hypothetical protein